jgi:cytochrome P450
LYEQMMAAEPASETIREDHAADARLSAHGPLPQFDEKLGAWVLSRHGDVLAAFHCASLYPSGLSSERLPDGAAEDASLAMRTETRGALSAPHLRKWQRKMASAARALAANLRVDEPVELTAAYTVPVCLRLASMVTNIDLREAERLHGIAGAIAASSAEPFDAELKAKAKTASAEIRGCFPSGPALLRDSGFVALARTLPSLLSNAWCALLESPGQWALLHKKPALLPSAVEELLRCAALPRILFRRALQDIDLHGARIRKGDRIVLRVHAGNTDPEQFCHAEQLDVRRSGTKHLALGAGAHSCIGAGLIRMAVLASTGPLVERFSGARLVEPVEYRGGSGYHFTDSLWVMLRGQP